MFFPEWWQQTTVKIWKSQEWIKYIQQVCFNRNKHRHLDHVVETGMDQADNKLGWWIFINSNICTWELFTD